MGDNIQPSADEKQLAAFSGSRVSSDDDRFNDRTISVKDWAARTFDDIPGQLRDYFLGLFPIATWIYRYNLTWFIGDVRHPPEVLCDGVLISIG